MCKWHAKLSTCANWSTLICISSVTCRMSRYWWLWASAAYSASLWSCMGRIRSPISTYSASQRCSSLWWNFKEDGQGATGGTNYSSQGNSNIFFYAPEEVCLQLWVILGTFWIMPNTRGCRAYLWPLISTKLGQQLMVKPSPIPACLTSSLHAVTDNLEEAKSWN